MSGNVEQIKVLIAYPSDAHEERDAIAKVFEVWNGQIGSHIGVNFLVLRWPQNAVATSVPGGDAQAAFDQTVADEADAVYAVFRYSAGTPTAEGYPSGTYQEIDHALKMSKPVHVFFHSGVPEPDNSSREALAKSFDEMTRLLDVRELVAKHVMFKEYESLDELARFVEETIYTDIKQILGESLLAQANSNKSRYQVRVGTMRPLASGFQPRKLVRDKINDEWCRGASAVVLQGGGGFGKTQLATQIMREALDSQPPTDAIVWADAATPAGVRRAYGEAATRLGLGSEETEPDLLAKGFIDHLSNNPDLTSLVILDNADEDFIELLDEGLIYPGDGKNRRMLITTRYNGPRVTGQKRRVVHVEVFNPTEAVSFIRDRLADNDMEELADDRIEELCEELGWLPLGLSISTSVMMRRRVPCSRFASQLAENKNHRDLLGEPDPDNYPRSLADVWTTTLQYLDTLSSAASIKRAVLAAALLDPAGHHARIWVSPALRTFVSGDSSVDTTDDEPDELILLEEYGLITLTKGAWPNITVRMHPMTSLAVLDSQLVSSEEVTVQEAALAVARAYQATWTTARYLDQADEALSVRNLVHLLRQPAADLFNTEILRTSLMAILRLADRGAPTAAKEMVESLLPEAELRLPDDHRDLLYAQYVLAHCIGEAGNHTMARDQLADVVRQQTDVLGELDPDTLESRVALAVEQGAAGAREPAIEQLEEIIPLLQQTFGAQSPQTFSARMQLAVMKNNADHCEEAVTEFRSLLHDEIQYYGTDAHQDILVAKSRLCTALGESGRVAEAFQESQSLVTTCMAVLGPTHIETFRTRGTAARWQANSGDVAGALASYRQLIDDMSQAVGTEHPMVLTQKHNLMFFLMRAGQLKEALVVGQQILSDRIRITGPESRGTLTTRVVLAHIYAASGRLDKAIAEYEDIATLRAKMSGLDSVGVLAMRERIAESQCLLRPSEIYIEELQDVLRTRLKVQDSTSPGIIMTSRRVACCYSLVGNTRETISELVPLVHRSEETLGPCHLQTFKTRHALGRAYIDDEQYEAAIEILTALAADEDRVISPSRPETMATRYQLARALALSGSVTEGVAALNAVFMDRLRILGPEHPDTLDTRRELALWQAQQGDIPGAIIALESLEKDQETILCPGHPQLLATRTLLEDLRSKTGG